MLIAHLPAGYILARLGKRISPNWPIGLTLAGSIIPDLDMLWFTFVDSSVHHHKLLPHLSIFWLSALSVLGLLFWIFRAPSAYFRALAAFAAGLLLHLILDSLFAPIWWSYPFSNQAIELFTIPATQSHWILSFILHWSFLLELAICGVALWLFFRNTE